LIADAEQRLRKASADAAKIAEEINHLTRQLKEAKQLTPPLAKKGRGLSDKWGTVLNFMVLRAPNPVTVDEVFLFAVGNRLEISHAAIRAQFYNHEKRGFLERVSDGTYSAASAARVYCDY
jgi:dihydrodipicolinate reductase